VKKKELYTKLERSYTQQRSLSVISEVRVTYRVREELQRERERERERLQLLSQRSRLSPANKITTHNKSWGGDK